MFLQDLIGQKASEQSLFQRLLFEVEANYEQYDNKYQQLLLEKHEDGQFEVMELIRCADEAHFDANITKFLKNKYWINVSTIPSGPALCVGFCRTDLTTKSAAIFKNGHIQISDGGFVDPDTPPIELTEEEIIKGIRELCGIMEENIDTQSKPKKAV